MRRVHAHASSYEHRLITAITSSLHTVPATLIRFSKLPTQLKNPELHSRTPSPNHSYKSLSRFIPSPLFHSTMYILPLIHVRRKVRKTLDSVIPKFRTLGDRSQSIPIFSLSDDTGTNKQRQRTHWRVNELCSSKPETGKEKMISHKFLNLSPDCDFESLTLVRVTHSVVCTVCTVLRTCRYERM